MKSGLPSKETLKKVIFVPQSSVQTRFRAGSFSNTANPIILYLRSKMTALGRVSPKITEPFFKSWKVRLSGKCLLVRSVDLLVHDLGLRVRYSCQSCQIFKRQIGL